MREFRGFSLNLWDLTRSHLNTLRHAGRTRLPWDGPNFPERPSEKHHSTHEMLQAVPESLWPVMNPLRILDAGCHDFSRGRAIHEFFLNQNPIITGIDADPHYLGKVAKQVAAQIPHSTYLREDFFQWLPPDTFPLVTAFFPFVSPHPALAWGLPHHWGDPHRWVRSLERCLAPGGAVFSSHQGEWEELEFADAIQNSSLQTVFRKELPSRATDCLHPIRIGLHIHRAT